MEKSHFVNMTVYDGDRVVTRLCAGVVGMNASEIVESAKEDAHERYGDHATFVVDSIVTLVDSIVSLVD